MHNVNQNKVQILADTVQSSGSFALSVVPREGAGGATLTAWGATDSVMAICLFLIFFSKSQGPL